MAPPPDESDNHRAMPAPGSAESLADDLPAYALGALDEGERAAVDAWLADDMSRSHELASYQAVADQLPLLVDEREPPPALRARLLASAAADQTAPPSATSPAAPTRLAWYRRPTAWAALAAALLVATLSLGAWSSALSGQLAEQRLRNQALERQLADSRQEVAALQRQPRVTVFAVPGTANAPNAAGQVIYVPQQQAAILTISNLPVLPGDRAYQVWFIQDGKPVSAGLLATAPNQAAARLPADLAQVQAIAVSVEPAGGSPAPTGPIVVQGPVTTGNA